MPADLALEGPSLRLESLASAHFEPLIALGSDGRIWENLPTDRSCPLRHRRFLEESLDNMTSEKAHVFAIFLRETSQLAGTTRLFHLSREHRQAEIGSWLAPSFWATGVNTEAKFLLLQLCFESLKMVRVQFRTDAGNARSRRALEKLGATCEGIFRKERIRENGTARDAVFFSILDDEWPSVREGLLERMAKRHSLGQPGAALLAENTVSAAEPVWAETGRRATLEI